MLIVKLFDWVFDNMWLVCEILWEVLFCWLISLGLEEVIWLVLGEFICFMNKFKMLGKGVFWFVLFFDFFKLLMFLSGSGVVIVLDRLFWELFLL